MREKIEVKVAEIIDYILGKEPQNITYNEYRILDAKLTAIKYDEEQKERNKELAEMMTKTIGYSIGSAPMPLPEPTEE